jgi:Holliday junction DNA helicase RuvA
MIGYLKGKIIQINEKEILILTESGVGYKAIINELAFAKLSEEKEAEIFIYHHKTENSENLFGFLNSEEEMIFKELIKISGIG